jgi:NAD(P)-dependent dehydrogenase (short-subunit alcohol dehydrogenase family)
VVITGASTGIGEACALGLDKLGFHVFAGVRREADGENLRRKATDRLNPLYLDVTVGDSVREAASRVETAVGEAGLAGLVNNAGIVIAGPMELVPLTEFRRQFEVNVIGQLAVIQAFLPLVRRARGRIINMGSISGRMATPFIGAYGASKFALEAITDALRVELLPWKISVSIIEPGSVATPIWEKSGKVAGDIARQIPEAQRRLYSRVYEAMRQATGRAAQAGISVEVVVRTVVHALTAPRPKTRYVVGRDARRGLFLSRILTDRMRDRFIIRHLGLPTTAEA